MSDERGVKHIDSSRLELLPNSKKGMSPLIATVLLIAFAVAVGAMIMNWSASIGEGGAGADCAGINMIINPYFCYAEGLIKMSVKNMGTRVESLTLRISDENFDNDMSLKNSGAGNGEIVKRDIPFEKTSTTYVALIPSIKEGEELVPCEKPAIEIESLPNC